MARTKFGSRVEKGKWTPYCSVISLKKINVKNAHSLPSDATHMYIEGQKDGTMSDKALYFS